MQKSNVAVVVAVVAVASAATIGVVVVLDAFLGIVATCRSWPPNDNNDASQFT